MKNINNYDDSELIIGSIDGTVHPLTKEVETQSFQICVYIVHSGKGKYDCYKYI